MITTVDIELVASFTWSQTLGTRLRSLREARGFTRKQLSEETAKIGRTVSMQYIQQLETPKLFEGKSKKPSDLAVSKVILLTLCTALDTDITSLVDCFCFSSFSL